MAVGTKSLYYFREGREKNIFDTNTRLYTVKKSKYSIQIHDYTPLKSRDDGDKIEYYQVLADR